MSARVQAIAVALMFAGLVAVATVSFLNTSSLKAQIADFRTEQRAYAGSIARSVDPDNAERKTISRIAQAENNIKVKIAQAARSISVPPISQGDIDEILFTVHLTNSSVSSICNELRGLDGDIALLLSGGRPEDRNAPTTASALSEAQERCGVIEQAHRYLRSEIEKLNHNSPSTALQLAWHEIHLLRYELFSIEFECDVHEEMWNDI